MTSVAKGWGHNIVNGDAATKRLLALNTALVFHTYVRQGNGRDRIGTLAWIDGWTLERKPLHNTAWIDEATLKENE